MLSRGSLFFPRRHQHLPDDLAGRQVALQAQQRRHAELAIHRAAHLARDADGIAPALRHEDGFDGAAVFETQQVAARAVGGFIAPRDFGQPHGIPLGKVLAQTGRKRGDLRQAGRLPAVDGLVELPGAVRRLAGAQSLAQIGKIHAHKRLRHSIIMVQGKQGPFHPTCLIQESRAGH